LAKRNEKFYFYFRGEKAGRLRPRKAGGVLSSTCGLFLGWDAKERPLLAWLVLLGTLLKIS